MSAKIPLIIDTDPGVDDFVSLLWVLANPVFDLKAITVTNGNVGIDLCVENALKAVELCRRDDIPVYKGSYRPLLKEVINADWYHGKDGLGDIGLSKSRLQVSPGYAPQRIAELAMRSAEPVTILSLAPLTNIALSLMFDPDVASHIGKIIFMGGAVRCGGNESPRASYNLKVDPDAAKIVYSSGIPVVQIGLDVCDLVTQYEEDVESIVGCGGILGDIIGKLLRRRGDRILNVSYPGQDDSDFPFIMSRKGIGLNDLTATGYLIDSSLFKTFRTYIDIETEGICCGETIADLNGLTGKNPNAEFAFDVKGRDLVDRWVDDMKLFIARLQ